MPTSDDDEGRATTYDPELDKDFPPALKWQGYRRYRLLRAAAQGLERSQRVIAEAIEEEAKKRGHMRLPFLARDEAVVADLARAIVEALVSIRALDMITPGIEVEALHDEQDRLARQKRRTRRVQRGDHDGEKKKK